MRGHSAVAMPKGRKWGGGGVRLLTKKERARGIQEVDRGGALRPPRQLQVRVAPISVPRGHRGLGVSGVGMGRKKKERTH
jgi:hypothetical protein